MKSFKNWLCARLAFIVDCLGLGLGSCRIFSDNRFAGRKSVKPQSAKQCYVPQTSKLSERKNRDNRKNIKRTGKRGK